MEQIKAEIKMEIARGEIISDEAYVLENLSYTRKLNIMVVDQVHGTEVSFRFPTIATSDCIYMLEECKERFQLWVHNFLKSRLLNWTVELLEGVDYITDRLDMAMFQLPGGKTLDDRHPPRNFEYRFVMKDVHFPYEDYQNNNVEKNPTEAPEPIPTENNEDRQGDEEVKFLEDDEEVKVLMEVITIED